MLITIKYLLPVKMEKMETMVNLETMVSLVRNGEPGHSPVISVDTFEGKLYWKVDDEWLLDSNSNKVAATGEKGDTGSAGKDGEKGPQGEQGDSVFKKDGVKIEDGKVIFTLANGKEFTLPMLVDGLAVGIGGSDLFYASPSDNSIDVTFASTMKRKIINPLLLLLRMVMKQTGLLKVVVR